SDGFWENLLVVELVLRIITILGLGIPVISMFSMIKRGKSFRSVIMLATRSKLMMAWLVVWTFSVVGVTGIWIAVLAFRQESAGSTLQRGVGCVFRKLHDGALR